MLVPLQMTIFCIWMVWVCQAWFCTLKRSWKY